MDFVFTKDKKDFQMIFSDIEREKIIEKASLEINTKNLKELGDNFIKIGMIMVQTAERNKKENE